MRQDPFMTNQYNRMRCHLWNKFKNLKKKRMHYSILLKNQKQANMNHRFKMN